jgi:hypothetical protein
MPVKKVQDANRDKVMTRVFQRRFKAGADEVPFSFDDIREAIAHIRKTAPAYKEDNPADVKYQFASGRRALPAEIERHGPWMIDGRGKGLYAFVRIRQGAQIDIPADLVAIPLPDATPEIVAEYAGKDEQGILAKVRYNRMLDIFLGITCYHLQNHWRTTIRGKGQIEIDDLYVGLDTDGRSYVCPIEAKSFGDRLSRAQVFQLVEFAAARYPELTVRPVGVQEQKDGSLVFLEFSAGKTPDDVRTKMMRRYELLPMDQIKEQGRP